MIISKLKNIFILFLIWMPAIAQAGTLDSGTANSMNDMARNMSGSAGFPNATKSDFIAIAAYAIKAFLSVLGIIFLILIILAGYKWMMSQGEEAKVEEAKDAIKRAIIGLCIIIASYAITYFVFNVLPWNGLSDFNP